MFDVLNPVSPLATAKARKWSEDAAQDIARRCLYWTENGATLDIQRTAAIIRTAHSMEFGGEWEYCKPCEASEFWNGAEWKPIGMAAVKTERQVRSHNHRRRVHIVG